MIKIFTLNWNGKDKINKLLPGLKKNLDNVGFPYVWYVRDNGSKDLNPTDVEEWKNQINLEWYDVGHNRASFAEGMNFLADKADIQDDNIIMLLNNDIEFGDDVSLQKMFNILKDSNVGIVGARLLYSGTDILAHSGTIFSKKYNYMPYHYRHKEKSDVNTEKNREFQAVTAACLLTSGSIWKEVGGLDTKFVWAFEDVDFNLKVKQLGKKVVYCGKTKIYHEESATLKKNPMNQMFMQQNVRNFKEKWSGKYDIDHDKYLKDPNYMLYGN